MRHAKLALGAVCSLTLASCLLPELTKRAYDASEGNGGSSSGNGGKPSGAGSEGEGARPAAGSNDTGQGGAGGDGAPTAGSGATSGSSMGGVPSAGSSQGGSSPGGGAGSMGEGGAGGEGSEPPLGKFSFFVTSMVAMQTLSGSQDGFGGDLRYGESTGIAGADKICSEVAETSMAGSSVKQWRAFLSTSAADAKDRIGEGPWYDRLERLVATDLSALLSSRPAGADAAIVNDLPNEHGVPNHRPDLQQPAVDNQAVLTGSNSQGLLQSATDTCSDWTSAAADGTKPRVGASWVRSQNQSWLSSHSEGGCQPGGTLVDAGGPQPGDTRVGAGGGYGAIYCFALDP